jgi:hypothetical protein
VEIKGVYLIANYKGVRSNYLHNKEAPLGQVSINRPVNVACACLVPGHMQKEDEIGQLEPFDLLPR